MSSILPSCSVGRMNKGSETQTPSVGLSIRQPWVELILSGRKSIEVRSWPTQHRGVLWLHAGKRVETVLCSQFGLDAYSLPVGAFVGRCQLIDCFEFDARSWKALHGQHLNSGELPARAFGWRLSKPERICAYPYRGALSLMKISDLVVSCLGGSDREEQV